MPFTWKIVLASFLAGCIPLALTALPKESDQRSARLIEEIKEERLRAEFLHDRVGMLREIYGQCVVMHGDRECPEEWAMYKACQREWDQCRERMNDLLHEQAVLINIRNRRFVTNDKMTFADVDDFVFKRWNGDKYVKPE